MIPLKFLRRHWHDIGVFSAMAAAIYLIVAWNDLHVLQRLLLVNFIIILLHQFEEYSWPGGFPAIFNMVFMPSSTPDRYPLNQNSSMVANLILAYGFNLVPVFFHGAIWFGLAPVFLGVFIQVIGHVILINYRLRSLYNPGVATALFGHLPVGILYIHHIQANHLVQSRDWAIAVGYLVVFVGLLSLLELKLLGDKNSPYPFDPDEMQRFGVAEKLERARRRRSSRTVAGIDTGSSRLV